MKALALALLLCACGTPQQERAYRLAPWEAPSIPPGAQSQEDAARCGERPILSPVTVQCPGDVAPIWVCGQVAGSEPLERHWNWRWIEACP